MGIVGKHVFGSLYGITNKRVFDDETLLEKIVREAAVRAGATIIEARSWKIEGEKGGTSVLVLVDESHLAVHTWKEFDYATVDVYTCGEHTDPWKAWEHIVNELKPESVSVNYADRSQITPR